MGCFPAKVVVHHVLNPAWIARERPWIGVLYKLKKNYLIIRRSKDRLNIKKFSLLLLSSSLLSLSEECCCYIFKSKYHLEQIFKVLPQKQLEIFSSLRTRLRRKPERREQQQQQQRPIQLRYRLKYSTTNGRQRYQGQQPSEKVKLFGVLVNDLE